MKNLQLHNVLSHDLQLGPYSTDGDPICHFCLDSTEGLLYAVTSTGIVLCFADNGKKLVWSQPVMEGYPEYIIINNKAVPLIVSVSHVLELDAIFIACSTGQLLLLHTDTNDVEEVGVVSGGIAAAGWSPDGELLVLLGFNQSLLMMNKDWDVLAEVSVPAPDNAQQSAAAAAAAASAPQLISATLSWRGDSKYFATNTLWQQTSTDNLQQTASTAAAAGGGGGFMTARVLHIWDREDCHLHATAEAAAGLSAAIAWQPNSRHLYAAAAVAPASQTQQAAAAADTAGFNSKGQPLKAAPHQGGGAATTVAATKGLKNQPQNVTNALTSDNGSSSSSSSGSDGWMQHILLYERNGLQHGGFDVPTYSNIESASSSSSSGSSKGGLVIQAMHWSSDSELLAVVLAPAGAGQQQQQQQQDNNAEDGSSSTHEWHVQLWHRSNWHWYLKHEQLFLLPDSAGMLTVAWDDLRSLRLHLMMGSGSYTIMDYDWGVAVSGRGTAAVIDGHQLLITPLRHCHVPPPMCPVRAVLPRPINALAWLDGNIQADLGTAAAAAGDNNALQQQQQQQGEVVDVVQQGLCEVLAVLLSDGQIVFLRSVESDLWEETLEDQVALGGPREYLLPMGYCIAAAAAAAAAAANGSNGGGSIVRDHISMTSGPWTPLDDSSSSNTYNAAAAEQVHQMEQQYLPMRAAAAARNADVPSIPLAEGRLVMGLVWLSKDRLLLLAAPYPPEEGLEEGQGTVLIEVAVDLPPAAAAAAAAVHCVNGFQVNPEPETQALGVGYAGSRVLTAAAHPAGGALLQSEDGQLLYYSSSSGKLQQLPSNASFPVPSRTMIVLPNAPALTSGSTNAHSAAAAAAAAAAAPALGLSAAGALYWGNRLVANDVISVAVRGGGPGGPAVLFTTRQALLFVVMISQLPHYQHILPDESSGQVSWKRSEYPGDLRAAMSVAMRPAGAAAAAREPHIRAVEPGAMVLASPWGGVGVILQMQRGNLEGINPRLLTLAAICDALDSHNYARAWDLTITNRVDINLLVDYAWPRFLRHADDFVADVSDPSDLCDLFFALRNDSVLCNEGMYGSLKAALGWQQQHQATTAAAASGDGLNALAAGLGQLSVSNAPAAAAAGGDSSSSSSSSSKVSAVCDAIRSAVMKIPGRYMKGHLKTVVMSYAKSEPPSLELALKAIREVKEAATAAAAAVSLDESSSPSDLSAAADAALKHLLLYVDVDQLYRTALGLYDLSLAFMVVSHSQKDPGEYLAELTSFGSQTDENLGCYNIDMSLGRYDKALEHLVAADRAAADDDDGHRHFDAALKLAQDKGLLRQLLAIVQQQQQQQQQQQGDGVHSSRIAERYTAVLSAYGDALLDQRKAEDAAVAYSAAGLTERALTAYKTAGSWRMCMVLAARLNYTQQQQQLLARDLAEQLQSSGAAAAAAQLLLQYLADVDGGVSALVAAKEWREALRVSYAADRGDLVDTVVVPAAAQAASSTLSEANESIERLEKYTARLTEVRQRRVAMEAALAAADAEAAGAAAAAAPDDDLVSESPSMISGFSMYTDRTAAAMTGIGGSSIASSSRAASTIGGRRPLRNQKKAAKKGKAGKIRAGSPGEETALAAHLETLVPPKHVLEEAGQLTELLVMLHHVEDARKLQQRVGQWQAAAAAAMEEVRKGQQQQQQGGGIDQQQQQQASSGVTAAAAAAVSSGVLPGGVATRAAEEVSWKWEVLRQHS